MAGGMVPRMDAEAPLMVVRTATWRFAVPMSDVERVLAAAMPVGLPSASGTLAVRLDDALVPVVFGASLFGADEVTLRAGDKMVVLASDAGRTILWVDAVEDVVPFVPLPAGASAVAPADLDWVSCVSGGDETLAVLDAGTLHQAARVTP